MDIYVECQRATFGNVESLHIRLRRRIKLAVAEPSRKPLGYFICGSSLV